MIRRNLVTLWGVGLSIAAACTGGGAPNDFGPGSSGNAPPSEGSPNDPNAPPANTGDPPFGDVAPPTPTGVPGGTDPPTGPDCDALCADVEAAGCGDDCYAICPVAPTACESQLTAYFDCISAVQCDEELIEDCVDELDDLEDCVDDPDGPGPGAGGQGGI